MHNRRGSDQSIYPSNLMPSKFYGIPALNKSLKQERIENNSYVLNAYQI